MITSETPSPAAFSWLACVHATIPRMAGKIWVTAGEGRIAPIDPSIATAPGAQMLFLKPGDKLEVDPSDSRIFRQMRSGDLVETAAPKSDEPAPLPPESVAVPAPIAKAKES